MARGLISLIVKVVGMFVVFVGLLFFAAGIRNLITDALTFDVTAGAFVGGVVIGAIGFGLIKISDRIKL
jgi:uncharacterized membrane protein YqgA involved in biofilm formation